MAEPGGAPLPGWYPDPAGSPGVLRYWDGRGWSEVTRPIAATAPPRPGRLRWILGFGAVGLVVLVALVVVIVTAIRPDEPPAADAPPPAGPTTTATPASLSCAERQPDFTEVPTSQARVRSGRVSFPELGAPFVGPTRTTLLRFDYLKDVAAQFATLRYHGQSTGAAEVMISRVPIADGFSTPQQVARLLYRCVQERFPNAEEKVRQNQATMIAGRRSWLIRSHLGYGVVDAGIKSEEIIVAVIPTIDGENGLFYADVPDTHPELLPRVQQALAKLTVS